MNLQMKHTRHHARRFAQGYACEGSRCGQRGAVAVELIIMFPVLLIFLAAVVEFGLILAGTKQVALASRNGAKLAAQSGTLDALAVNGIRNSINRQLATAGFGNSATTGITVQHNVGGSLTAVSDGTCPAPMNPPLPSGDHEAVRVTVCVDLSQLTPDLLGTFGFPTTGKTVEMSTTVAYEL